MFLSSMALVSNRKTRMLQARKLFISYCIPTRREGGKNIGVQLISLSIWLHHPILNSGVLRNLADTSEDQFKLIFVGDIDYIFGEKFNSKQSCHIS